jgi:hypothetical protein
LIGFTSKSPTQDENPIISVKAATGINDFILLNFILFLVLKD